MSAKIRIEGDNKAIRKSILEVGKDIKELGKSKVQMFDKSQRDFLKKEAVAGLLAVNKQLQDNGKQIRLNTMLQNKQGKSLQEQVMVRQRLTELMKKQVALQKNARDFEDLKSSVTITPKKGILRREMDALKERFGSGLMKMGLLGIGGAAGALAISRARKAVGVFEGGVSDRVGLRGRGVGNMELEDPSRAERAGMSALDVRRARLSSMDVFGRSGSSQAAVTQRGAVERNFGMGAGTLTGLGGQMRGQLGGRGADKAVMTIQASLIASGITDEIGPYLETSAAMLTQLNERGFTFNDSALAVLNSLARSGASPERAGRIIGGVDQAIKGSSGEANAIFQQIFSGAGVGGKTVGGLQAAIRSGGLFGANLEDNSLVGKTDKGALSQAGIGGRTGQRVASSAVRMFDKMFGTDQEIDKLLQGNSKQKQAGATRRIQRMNFIKNTFGLESEVQAAEVNTMLRQMADPETSSKKRAEIEKNIKDLQSGGTELGNLKLISKSVEGNWEETKKLHETVQDALGAKIAPAFLLMDKTMMKLDLVLTALLDFFGIKTPSERAAQALTGESVTSRSDVDQFTMGDPAQQREFAGKFADEMGKKEERLRELDRMEADAQKPGGRGRLTVRETGERQTLRDQLGNMRASEIGRPADDDRVMTRGTGGPVTGQESILDGMMRGVFEAKPKSSVPMPKPAEDPAKILSDIKGQLVRGNRVNERNERNTRKTGTVPAGTGRTN